MVQCNCNKQALGRTLTFQKCERGFILRSGGGWESDRFPSIYAFDRVEDLAAFLVSNFAEQALA